MEVMKKLKEITRQQTQTKASAASAGEQKVQLKILA